jgi:Flp pilus assembly pilin Flp
MARRNTQLKSDVRGHGYIEYMLIVVLIGLGTMTAMTAFGSEVSQSYDRISARVESAVPAN